MSALTDAVQEKALAKVRVAYLDGDTCKWWNQRKKSGDTAMFSGWYWTKGTEEAGPFKTRSAAIRDAYYRVVLLREPPSLAIGRSGKFQRSEGKHKEFVAPSHLRVVNG